MEKKLIDDLFNVAEIVGHIPNKKEYKIYGNYDIELYLKIKKWRDWQKYLLPKYNRTNSMKIPHNLLSNDLIRVKNIIGKIPSKNEYKNNGGKYSLSSYDRIKLWSKWIEDTFHIKSNVIGKVCKKITNEELINNLLELNKKLGRTPKKEDLTIGKYSNNTYRRAFGTFTKSLIAAGLKPNEIRGMSDEELLNEIKKVYNKLGRTPSTKEFSELSITTNKTIFNRFGTWTNALKKAGVPILTQGKISKKEVTDALIKWYNDNNQNTQCLEYWAIRKAHNRKEFPYSCNTISTKFNKQSWENIMKTIDSNYETKDQFVRRGSFLGNDNHIYLSSIECQVANILYDFMQNEIIDSYEYEGDVCLEKTWTCDFKIYLSNKETIWLEVDGMRHSRKDPYNSGENEKINYYDENKINYHILSYTTNNVKKEIFDLINKQIY